LNQNPIFEIASNYYNYRIKIIIFVFELVLNIGLDGFNTLEYEKGKTNMFNCKGALG
jgi:hypothetical protein